MKIRIVNIDDHELILDGIRLMTAADSEIEILAQFTSAAAFYAKAAELNPDIITLDLKLKNESGIDAANYISEKFPDIRIIMLSAITDESAVMQALKAGVMGYLPKETDKFEVIKAIKSVYAGSKYFGTEISQKIYNSFIGTLNSPLDVLTTREIEVLRLIAAGKPQKNIADELCMSLRTVEVHKKSIHEKLKLETVAELVKFAVKNHLSEL